MATSRLSLLKYNNRAQVSLAVRKYGPISRVEVAKICGLSMTCVCSVIDQLLAEGVVIESGTSLGPRGGPRTLLEINPDGDPVAGVVLRTEVMEVAIAGPKGDVLQRRQLYYPDTPHDPASLLASVATAVKRCAEAAGKDPSSIRGVGVAVAGLVDTMLGVVHRMPDRPGWDDVPIARILSENLHTPVFADNDIRAGAAAAQLLGGESRFGGVLYMVVSDGIGAAFVHNEELFRGAHDAGCLLGHITMERNGPLCDCGKRGCLAAVATDLAFIQRIWPDALKPASEMSVATRENLVGRGLAMALSGDPVAHSALMITVEYLGVAVANAVNMFDPLTVFMGGTMIEAADNQVIDMVRKETMRHIWSESSGVEIRPLLNYTDFTLNGAIGLVLGEPYRAIQREMTKTRTVRRPGAVR